MRLQLLTGIVLLAGCSAAGGVAPTAAISTESQGQSSVAYWQGRLHAGSRTVSRLQFGARSSGAPHYVFLADAALNLVYTFRNGRSSGQIEGFEEPQGLATDAKGTLYVADTVHNAVKEFTAPYTGPPAATIVEPRKYPVDVAVAPDGTVAVLNICTGPSCSLPGGVDFYAKDNTMTPCATIASGPQERTPLFGAFDAHGTLYFGAVSASETISIAGIAGECAATGMTTLKPTNSIHFPAGTQVDHHGNIVIGDSGGFTASSGLDIYRAPAPGSTKLRLLQRAPLADTGVFSSFALTKSGTDLYTAEPHYALQYAYPAAGYALSQLVPGASGGDLIEGVAVVPAEQP